MLIETVLKLQYCQGGVLSAEGAATLMKGLLNWLKEAEDLTGRIPESAEDAWRMVVILMTFLTQTLGVGVGKDLFDELLKTIEKLNFNQSALHERLKKDQDRHKALLKKIPRSTGAKLEKYQQEFDELEKRIPKETIKDARLRQLITDLHGME